MYIQSGATSSHLKLCSSRITQPGAENETWKAITVEFYDTATLFFPPAPPCLLSHLSPSLYPLHFIISFPLSSFFSLSSPFSLFSFRFLLPPSPLSPVYSTHFSLYDCSRKTFAIYAAQSSGCIYKWNTKRMGSTYSLKVPFIVCEKNV